MASISRPRDVDERPIAWREAGQGPPVIFLHAMAGSRTAWEPQMAALSASYRCIAWDMPGFGASAPPRAGAFMDDVVAALATVTLGPLGLQSAHFVGLSVGGMILQHFAVRHPALVRSLTIMDTSPKFAFGGSGSPEGFLGPIVEGFEKGMSIAAFSEGMVRAIVGPRCPEAVKREAIASMARGTVAGMELAARLIAYHDGLAALARIKAPVLAIAGEADAETPVAYARHIAENVQNGELFVVPDAGHIANLENPAAVNGRLLAFLSKHTG